MRDFLFIRPHLLPPILHTDDEAPTTTASGAVMEKSCSCLIWAAPYLLGLIHVPLSFGLHRIC
jgi:hypothetical protein